MRRLIIELFLQSSKPSDKSTDEHIDLVPHPVYRVCATIKQEVGWQAQKQALSWLEQEKYEMNDLAQNCRMSNVYFCLSSHAQKHCPLCSRADQKLKCAFYNLTLFLDNRQIQAEGRTLSTRKKNQQEKPSDQLVLRNPLIVPGLVEGALIRMIENWYLKLWLYRIPTGVFYNYMKQFISCSIWLLLYQPDKDVKLGI